MSVARQLHVAALLPDGRALIAGGYLNSSAEIFDPRTASWSTTGPLTTNRYQSTATLLPTGKVLVAGGSDYRILASAELFDPATATWGATGSMPNGHVNHTATLLANGKVLVAGGWSGTVYQGIANAELYDPASGTWVETAPMLSPRFDHPASGTWSPTASMNIIRISHTATLLRDGRVLIAGGWNSPMGALSDTEIMIRRPAIGPRPAAWFSLAFPTPPLCWPMEPSWPPAGQRLMA